MEKEEFKVILIEFYPEYYKQVSGSKKYRFKLDDKRESQIDKFVDYVFEKIKPETIGEDLIRRYLQFAFGNMIGRENPWGKVNAFPLNWIIARAVLDKFFKAKGYEKYRRTKKLKSQGNSILLIKSKTEKIEIEQQKQKFFLNIKQHEEKEKEKFFNTEKGRVWCIDFTTLYNPKSKYCEDCKFKDSCINLLKTNFDGLYNIRVNERNI